VIEYLTAIEQAILSTVNVSNQLTEVFRTQKDSSPRALAAPSKQATVTSNHRGSSTSINLTSPLRIPSPLTIPSAIFMRLVLLLLGIASIQPSRTYFLERDQPPYCTDPRNLAPCDVRTEQDCCQDDLHLAHCGACDLPKCSNVWHIITCSAECVWISGVWGCSAVITQ
jgi:hypothetical protein